MEVVMHINILVYSFNLFTMFGRYVSCCLCNDKEKLLWTNKLTSVFEFRYLNSKLILRETTTLYF